MQVWYPVRTPSLASSFQLSRRNAICASILVNARYFRIDPRPISLVYSRKQLPARFRQASSTSPSNTSPTPSPLIDKPQPGSTLPSTTSNIRNDIPVTEKDKAVNPPVLKKANEPPKEPFLPRMWAKVKHEANHYWDGTKLLASEIKISARLLRRTLQGKQLTRRERRQLRRTTQDLLRLVPFSVFVIVPFMELLLPVAIKIFPNMLPSTFEDKFAADEKKRKLLRVRLEMAKFLQETLRESGIKGGKSIIGTDEFKAFFYKVRSTGETPSTEDIVKVAKLFHDELTLDNLSRPQLVSICRYMGVNAFGTDNFLKYQIRNRIEHLKKDDRLIHVEGVDSLSTSELQHACQSRGVRTTGISPSRLREELEKWIELHLINDISGVLLILSRAFDWGENRGSEGVITSLGSVLASLPDNLLNEAELAVDSEKASYKQKLEVLQQQEELIEDEAEQEQKEEDARRAKKELEERLKHEEEARTVESMLPDSEWAREPEDDARMTTEQLAELGEALSILSAKSSVIKERDELRAIVEQNLQSEEETSGEASPSQSLSKRIRGMLTKIDSQLCDYDARVGSSLQLISADSQGRITVRDLERAFSVIKHKPDAETVEGIVKKLDVDQDGFVVLEHVLDLVREEGLGIVVDEGAKDIIGQGRELKELKPRKEDIVQE